MKKILSALTIFSLLFICFNINHASSNQISTNSVDNTLFVGGSGSSNYSSIQDAIDNSSEGDTIYVYSGTYNGFEIDNKKDIKIIGENKETTEIKSLIEISYKSSCAILIRDSINLTISNFKINNVMGFIDDKMRITIGILLNSFLGTDDHRCCRINISNNIIKNFSIGIFMVAGRENIIRENEIKNNIIGVNIISNLANIGQVSGFSENNKICKNNFYKNILDAFDTTGNLRKRVKGSGIVHHKNIWLNNYWGRPHVLPKIIRGGFFQLLEPSSYKGQYPTVDRRPALKPNEI